MPYQCCHFCGATSNTVSDRSFFRLKNDIKETLHITEDRWIHYKYICSAHFETSDILSGERNKLAAGAFPVVFPLKELVNHDHTYSKCGSSREDEEEEIQPPISQLSNSQSASQSSDKSWSVTSSQKENFEEEDNKEDNEEESR